MNFKSKIMKIDCSEILYSVKSYIISLLILAMVFTVSCSSVNYQKTPSNTTYQPTEEEIANADYGEYPDDYKKLIEDYMQTRLLDPYSAHYRYTMEPQKK